MVPESVEEHWVMHHDDPKANNSFDHQTVRPNMGENPWTILTGIAACRALLMERMGGRYLVNRSHVWLRLLRRISF